jgi:DNA-binding beta-propeller fold protein YncE
MKTPGLLLLCFAALSLDAAEPTTLKLTKTIPLPGVAGRIDHMAADTQGHRLFMAALGNDTVEVMDVETGKRLQTISGCSEPQGLVFLPKLNRLFIANGSSGELKICDGEKFQFLKTIGSLADADNVRFDAAGNRVYVGFGSGALGVIDTNGVQIASVPLDGHPESFQLEQNGNRIFVNVPSDRSIAVIDRAQQKVVTKWRLESAHSNFPMALDEANHRLFIGCRSAARLLVLDTTSGKTVAQVEIAGDTDDVFYDAKRNRLYISCGEGFLDVIQRSAGDRYERIAHEPTRGGARTCFYSPDSDRLYLAVPKNWGQDAEIRIYRPQ